MSARGKGEETSECDEKTREDDDRGLRPVAAEAMLDCRARRFSRGIRIAGSNRVKGWLT